MLARGWRWSGCWVAFAVACSGQCDDSSSKRNIESAWSNWPELMEGAPGRAAQLEALRSERRSIEPLKPFRRLEKARAVRAADELLARVGQPGESFDDLEPPLDWGASPDKSRNAHAGRNSWRPLVPLVRAHYETKEPRYLAYLASVAKDWIDFNLVRQKPNVMKWHDKPAGERAIKIAYLLDQTLRRKNPDADWVGELVWAAEKHMRRLADPHLYTSGNHGLYVALGLKALTAALPRLKGAKGFGAYADEKLHEQLLTCYTASGFHREHSAEYQEITIKSVQGVFDSGLFTPSKKLLKLQEAAKQHVYQLYHPNGDRLLINDSERGFKKVAGTPEHLAFLHSEGKRGEAPEAGLHVYEDVGYAFFRSPWSEKPFKDHSYLFFAPGYLSKHHKQADHLTFEWSEAGRPILVDSGKFDFANNEWRDFFLSTRAGNAVEVDGKDYTREYRDAWGSGLSGYGTKGELQFLQADVEHRRFGVRQQRSLILKPRHWLCIVDRLSSQKKHTYRQWFHFHEDWQVKEAEKGFEARADEDRVFVQALHTPDRVATELARGQLEPRINGWISPKLRKKTKRFSVAFRVEGKDALVVTLFALDEPASGVKVEHDPKLQRVRIGFTHSGVHERFSLQGRELTLN